MTGNKAKIRRINKMLDNLYSKGKYWDWLIVANESGLLNSLGVEAERVIVKITRDAFGSMKGFEGYVDKVEAISKITSNSNIRALYLLSSFVKEGRRGEELTALSGISPEAKRLCNRASSWQDELFPEEKISRVLQKFAQRPSSINKKDYIALADLLDGTSISGPLRILSEYIQELGDFLKKKYKFNRISFDDNLRTVSAKIPEDLRKVLLYPFAVKTAYYLMGFQQKGKSQMDMIKIGKDMPFLFSLAAGQGLEEINLELRRHSPGAKVLKEIDSSLSATSLEEKALLINDIKRMINNDSNPEPYHRLIRNIWLSILEDIERLLATLTERQRRELPKVMEPLIMKDFDIFFDMPSSTIQCLKRIHRAGCMGVRLLLFTVVMAEYSSDIGFSNRLIEELREMSTPNEEDIKWLINKTNGLVTPDLRHYRPFIDLFRGERGIIKLFSTEMANHAIFLYSFQFLIVTVDLPSRREMAENTHAIGLFRNGIDSMKGIEGFELVVSLSDCLKDGPITVKSMVCFFTVVIEKSGLQGLIDYYHTYLLRAPSLSELYGFIRKFSMENPLLVVYEEALIEVLKAHWGVLLSAHTDTILALKGIMTNDTTNWTLLVMLQRLLTDRNRKDNNIERAFFEDVERGLLNLSRKTTKKKSHGWLL